MSCNRNVIKEVYSDKNEYIKLNDLLNKYRIVKTFTTGRGCAFIYLIESDSDKRILKIYPLKKIEENVHETFVTCVLASLPSYPPKCVKQPCAKASDFFPRFYEYGNIQLGYKKVHNYMIIEYIENGISFLEILENYREYADKYSREILFQTLYAIWYARIHKRFQHNDLHPENILIVKDSKKDRTFILRENGKRTKFLLKKGAPIVRIIDFGESIWETKYKSRDMTKVLYSFLRKRNVKKKVIVEQIAKVKGYNSDIKFWLMMKLAFMEPDQQIQLDNLCRTIYECLDSPYFSSLKVA